MARLGVPVGGRVRKLRAVEDQSAPTPGGNERAWRDHLMDGGRSTRSGGQSGPPPKDGRGKAPHLTIWNFAPRNGRDSQLT
jgi:hypothetical protein